MFAYIDGAVCSKKNDGFGMYFLDRNDLEEEKQTSGDYIRYSGVKTDKITITVI